MPVVYRELTSDFRMCESPVEVLVRDDDSERWAHTWDLPRYLISSHGRVWSLYFLRMKQFTDKGYLAVSIGKTMYLVHRLVAFAFVPGFFKNAQVNHKDGNKKNNHWQNLEWVTPAENNRHAWATGLHTPKLTPDDKRAIRREVMTTKRQFSDIAQDFGVTGQTVRDIVNGHHENFDELDLSHRPRRGKLSDKQMVEGLIPDIRDGKLTYTEIAQKYEVSRSTVSNIAAGRIRPDLTSGMRLTPDRRKNRIN